MITLIMFLFLAGGKKSKPAPPDSYSTVFTCVSDVCRPIESGGDPSLHASQITSDDGAKAVKLTDDEYAHLRALRQAVVDEEKRLAVKYGAQIEKNLCPPDHACFTIYRSALSHYEYHGQFLLIEKGK